MSTTSTTPGTPNPGATPSPTCAIFDTTVPEIGVDDRVAAELDLERCGLGVGGLRLGFCGLDARGERIGLGLQIGQRRRRAHAFFDQRLLAVDLRP